jgi:hypothetical protein
MEEIIDVDMTPPRSPRCEDRQLDPVRWRICAIFSPKSNWNLFWRRGNAAPALPYRPW